LDSDASIIYKISASMNEITTPILWLFNNFFQVQEVNKFEMGKEACKPTQFKWEFGRSLSQSAWKCNHTARSDLRKSRI